MVLNIPFYRCGRSSGVERNLAKVDVEGSNPFTRSNSKPPFQVAFLCFKDGELYNITYAFFLSKCVAKVFALSVVKCGEQ